jgi:hypothetical protein
MKLFFSLIFILINYPTKKVIEQDFQNMYKKNSFVSSNENKGIFRKYNTGLFF